MSGLRHRALLYRDDAELVSMGSAWLRDGVRAGEHIVAVAPRRRLGALREELGDDADGVAFTPAEEFHARLGTMFTALGRLFERHGGPDGPGLRLLAGNDLAALPPAASDAYHRYEAALNAVYASSRAQVLCPYDARELDDAALRRTRCTHPEVVGHPEDPDAGFLDPVAFLRCRSPLPSGGAALALEGPDQLGDVRRMVRHHAREAGLDAEAGQDLALAVTELAVNALRHGSPPCSVELVRDGGDLVAVVRDAGAGPPPLAGYGIPGPDQAGGRGLWLAHQLSDVVTVDVGPEGTAVAVRMLVH